MQVHIANYEPGRQGGGWTFARNFASGLGDKLVSYDSADVYFIAGPTMVGYIEAEEAKRVGKKIILRVDNIVRNSRNRNTGMSRMKAFAEMADLVVYQSEYAKEILGKQFLGIDGPVILNGCDTTIFHPKGREEALEGRFLYSRINRDETKNWEMARFTFQQESFKREGNAILNIVGQFSPDLIEYNFDFYNNEKYHYWGVIQDAPTMAEIYRNNDYLIYTFWNDACSNTLIEALCSGCNIVDPYGMLETGGSSDIIHHFEVHGGIDYFSIERMTKEYLEAISECL